MSCCIVIYNYFLYFFFFFFSSRRRHTRYIGDWSSDVCSSDLVSSLAVTRCLEDQARQVPCFPARTHDAAPRGWRFAKGGTAPAPPCRCETDIWASMLISSGQRTVKQLKSWPQVVPVKRKSR